MIRSGACLAPRSKRLTLLQNLAPPPGLEPGTQGLGSCESLDLVPGRPRASHLHELERLDRLQVRRGGREVRVAELLHSPETVTILN